MLSMLIYIKPLLEIYDLLQCFPRVFPLISETFRTHSLWLVNHCDWDSTRVRHDLGTRFHPSMWSSGYCWGNPGGTLNRLHGHRLPLLENNS